MRHVAISVQHAQSLHALPIRAALRNPSPFGALDVTAFLDFVHCASLGTGRPTHSGHAQGGRITIPP